MKARESDYDLILKNVSRFIDLSDAEKELFKSLLQKGSAQRREFILRPGYITS